MGNGSEGAGGDGSNGTGLRSIVLGGGAVGDLIPQRELGVDRLDAQGPGGVPPLDRARDHGDDGKTRFRQRLGVPLGSGGNGSRGDPPY